MDKYALFSELIKSSDMEQVMEWVYAILGNPAFIIDMGYNVLGYTKVPVENERWDQIVVHAKIGKDIVDGKIQMKAEHAKAMNSYKAILLENTYEQESQIKKHLFQTAKKSVC